MDPNELLAQIATLMEQYIQMGGDTPLAQSMPGMLEEVQAGMEGEVASEGVVPEEEGLAPAPTFEGAEQAALEAYKGGFGSPDQAKTEDEAQPETEDEKKRRKAR